MCPPTGSFLAFDCDNEEIFTSLVKIMTSGSPLPENVITDVNPYNFLPSNLPEDIWFLIRSKENEGTEHGFWREKGEACKVFSNHFGIGWRMTLEFCEGQVPHVLKTDWLMHKCWITPNVLGAKSKGKESPSLCRVFLGGEHCLNHKKKQRIESQHITSATDIHSTQPIVPVARDDTRNGSTSKHMVDNDDETTKLVVAGTPPSQPVENPPENDWFSGGDFMELLDFGNPTSRSSSSDNSSRRSMSSDECFDSLALLRDIESQNNQESAQKDGGCKFSVSASNGADEMIMFPSSPGSCIRIEGSRPPADEILGTNLSPPGLANSRKDLDNKVLQHAVKNQKPNYRDEGPSSNPRDVGKSPISHIASPDGVKKAAKGRKKKPRNKYLCFIPFDFLF